MLILNGIERLKGYSITFYDASYVYLVSEINLPLLTEDNKLSRGEIVGSAHGLK
ncbi:MAG: hypothetical protein RXR43_04595 [Sulfolobus sp.]